MNKFFSELKKTKRIIKWELTSKGKIRGSLKVRPSQRFCPLTAVYYLKTKTIKSIKRPFNTDELTRNLADDFSYITQWDITDAADTKTENPSVRERLLKTLNLQEE